MNVMLILIGLLKIPILIGYLNYRKPLYKLNSLGLSHMTTLLFILSDNRTPRQRVKGIYKYPQDKLRHKKALSNSCRKIMKEKNKKLAYNFD
jgi:hypothetical protein